MTSEELAKAIYDALRHEEVHDYRAGVVDATDGDLNEVLIDGWYNLNRVAAHVKKALNL